MQAWTASLCAVSLGCTAAQMLVDNKSVGRILRVLLACCFLCAVFSSLSSLIPDDWGFGSVSDSDWLDKADSHTLSVLESTALRVANSALESNGYHAEKATVYADISESGDISIRCIVLYVDAGSYRQSTAVRQLAEKQLGCETVVRLYEG